MSLIYVSNVANNGYGLGNDTTGLGTMALPYLTLTKATTISVTGDTVIVNPSGTAYLEGSGTGLALPTTKALTYQTDLNLVGGSGQAVIKCAAANTFVLSGGTNTNAVPFNYLTIDGANTSGGNLVKVSHPTGSGLSFNNCVFQNSSANVFSSLSSTGNVLAVNNCTFAASCSIGLNISSGNFSSLTLTVNTFNNTGAVISGTSLAGSPALNITGNIFSGAMTMTNSTLASLVFNGNICNGNANFLSISGVTISGALNVNGNSFTGTGSSCIPVVLKNGTVAANVGSMTFNGNTATGTMGGAVLSIQGSTIGSLQAFYNKGDPSKGYFSIISEGVPAPEFAFNNITVPAGGTGDPFALGPTGANPYVHDNIIQVNSTAQVHAIMLGRDGYIADVQNSATETATQNLGDVSGNAYVDQAFTTSSAITNSQTHCSYIAGWRCTLKKVGNPTGTITAKLYTDSAGVPNTLVETSTKVLSAADPLITTFAQQFFWEFSSHSQMTASTKYHVKLHYTGTINGTDYIVLSSNTVVTGGSLSTSADDSVWVNDASHGLLYIVDCGCFGMGTPICQDNKITVGPGASVTTHALICGNVPTPITRRNTIIGSAFGIIYKDCFGGIIDDNPVHCSLGTLDTIYLKGSYNTQVMHNTAINTAASAISAVLKIGVNPEHGVNPPLPTGYTVENNVFVSLNGGYDYSLDVGATGTIDYNDAWFASGSAGIELNTYPTWAGWQGAGNDTHGLNADPLLGNETAPVKALDFLPTSSSPVIGRGVNLSGTVPSDFSGVVFSVTPPMGAFNPLLRIIAGSRSAALSRLTAGLRSSAANRIAI